MHPGPPVPAGTPGRGAALALGALFFLIIGFVFSLPALDWRLFWVPALALPLVAPLESLLLTPWYTRSGRFVYYSPMLVATRQPRGLDLHVGTIYDYARRLRWRDRGRRAARIVTADLLRGLLAIADDVHAGRLAPDAKIVATSFFFGSRSLARLGFEERAAPRAVVVNMWQASVSIALRLSFTHGRPAFPDLRRVRQAATTAGALAAHRRQLETMLAAVERQPHGVERQPPGT
jgi:hypothetical protein